MTASRIVPPPGPARGLALGQFANSVGDGAYYVSSALYFTTVVGLSPTRVGLALTLGWGLGAVAGVPLGQLADRRGPRGVAVRLSVLTATAVAAFLFVRSFPAFLAAVVLYTCCQCGLGAARQALLAGLVPAAERTATRAMTAATSNAGIAVGAGTGGVALAVGTERAYLAAFALDAVCFVVSALVLRRLPEVPPRAAVRTGGPRAQVLRDRPYALLTGLNSVMLLGMPLLSYLLPLWIAQRTQAPTWLVSGLLVLNTASVVAFQVRVAARVTGLRTGARSVRAAGVLMLLACAVFASSGYGTGAWAAALPLLAGALVQVLAEMLLAAGAWELSFGLAPDGRHGQYQGFFGSGTALARMLGPLLLTWLLLDHGPAGWLVLGGAFLTAGAATVPAARWAERTGGRAGGRAGASARERVTASAAAAPRSGPTASPTAASSAAAPGR